jgi:hypothetical protein
MKITKVQLKEYVREAVRSQLKEYYESDESVAAELKLFVDNDAELYRRMTQPMMKNLARKMKRGIYDSELAVKLWLYLATEGAKKYAKEHGGEGVRYHDMFPKSIRMQTAQELARDFEAELEAGGLDVDELAAYRSRR